MLEFDIALSALRASQRGLQVTANNLANVNTPGYHRQKLVLTEKSPIKVDNLLLGTGVDVARIERARDVLTELSINNTTSQLGQADARVEVLSKLESLFSEGSGSVHNELQDFFDQLDQLAVNPSDTTIRRSVIQSAQSLANSINDIAEGLEALQSNVDSQIDDTLGDLNIKLAQLSEINKQINLVEAQGSDANSLLDQRDQLVEELSSLVDVKGMDPRDPDATVYLASGGVVFTTVSPTLESVTLPDGTTAIVDAAAGVPLTFTSGKMAGLMEARNTLIDSASDGLNEFARNFVQAVDEIHGIGMGTSGPLGRIDGVRGVGFPNQPLAVAGAAFPVTPGSLFVGVTDRATGERTLHEIPYDPATDSLSDVSAAISTIPHLQGFIHTDDGSLSIVSEPGYGVDFTGQYATRPTPVAWSGTSQTTISGQYTGDANEEFTFQVRGSGQVGVTSGLEVDVFNSLGERVTTLNIGAGYSAGTPLEIKNGVKIQFSAGTVVNGNSSRSQVIADPDSGGLLSALGIGSLFSGTEAGNLSVRSEIVADPTLLSSAGVNAAGDNRVARLLAALRGAPLFNGTQSASEYLAELTSVQAFQSQDAQQQADNVKAVKERLLAERDSTAGVDTNEELMQMLNYQRMFQAASRFTVTINDMLQELMNIVR
jgi:flagellar hook-associated protein 1 FlgK